MKLSELAQLDKKPRIYEIDKKLDELYHIIEPIRKEIKPLEKEKEELLNDPARFVVEYLIQRAVLNDQWKEFYIDWQLTDLSKGQVAIYDDWIGVGLFVFLSEDLEVSKVIENGKTYPTR